MLVIAVGHTPEKMDRLLDLVYPQLGDWELLTVFNGRGFVTDLLVENHAQGRDIAMYAAGLEHATSGPPANRLGRIPGAIFVNDDVERLTLEALLPQGEDVVVRGVGNLDSWKDTPEGEMIPDTARFIRTSAFYMRAGWFWDVYAAAGGAAQAFEKATIAGLQRHQYELIHPQHAMDSNLRIHGGLGLG